MRDRGTALANVSEGGALGVKRGALAALILGLLAAWASAMDDRAAERRAMVEERVHGIID
jgi:hypothetical protein